MEKANEKTERIKVIRSALPEDQSAAIKNKNEDELIIECETGCVQLLEIQREGKKSVPAKDFINGLQGELKVIIK